MKIGFAGLGRMGVPMAARLLAEGIPSCTSAARTSIGITARQRYSNHHRSGAAGRSRHFNQRAAQRCHHRHGVIWSLRNHHGGHPSPHHVVTGTALYQLQAGELPRPRRYRRRFALALLRKDFSLALAVAAERKLNVPVAKTVGQVLDRARESGRGQRDIAAVLKMLRPGQLASRRRITRSYRNRVLLRPSHAMSVRTWLGPQRVS